MIYRTALFVSIAAATLSHADAAVEMTPDLEEFRKELIAALEVPDAVAVIRDLFAFLAKPLDELEADGISASDAAGLAAPLISDRLSHVKTDESSDSKRMLGDAATTDTEGGPTATEAAPSTDENSSAEAEGGEKSPEDDASSSAEAKQARRKQRQAEMRSKIFTDRQKKGGGVDEPGEEAIVSGAEAVASEGEDGSSSGAAADDEKHSLVDRKGRMKRKEKSEQTKFGEDNKSGRKSSESQSEEKDQADIKVELEAKDEAAKVTGGNKEVGGSILRAALQIEEEEAFDLINPDDLDDMDPLESKSNNVRK